MTAAPETEEAPPTGRLPGDAFQALIMAKAPVPGEVKTRLCPPLSLEQAAELAFMSLSDTLRAVAAARPGRTVIALSGPQGEWIPPGLTVVHQQGKGLDERIDHALAAAWSEDTRPVIVLGMDTPQLSPADILEAAAHLTDKDVDAVLGPACDGGYWALGIGQPVDRPCLGVPMSTRRTFILQLARLHRLDLRCRVLPAKRDVDRIEDALAVSASAPDTRFATALARMVGQQAPAQGR